MRLLDLYCGAGGAAVGYHRAGFEVIGVDVAPQPDYPFEFHQSDALDWLAEHGTDGFDAIHASPPCQRASALTKGTQKYAGRDHPNWIPQTRSALKDTGLPYVIENVIGSDLRRTSSSAERCSASTWSGTATSRPTSTSPNPNTPPIADGSEAGNTAPTTTAPTGRSTAKAARKGKIGEWQDAMGIDWTTHRRSIAEAIPPAYTAHIGRDLNTYIATPDRPPEGPRPVLRRKAAPPSATTKPDTTSPASTTNPNTAATTRTSSRRPTRSATCWPTATNTT